MGGLEHFKVALDPAILRINNVSVNRYKYFRFTKRTAFISFNFLVLVPSLFVWLGYSTEGKYNMRAKRRGDLISEY